MDILIPIITALLGGGGIFGLIKSGYLKISIGKNGNGHQAQDDINKELFKHADTANREMGEIKGTIKEVRDDYRQHITDDKDFQKEMRGKLDEILKAIYQK